MNRNTYGDSPAGFERITKPTAGRFRERRNGAILLVRELG